VEPELGQLYIGWKELGEWINYTVVVEKLGLYAFNLFDISNLGGEISISVNGNDLIGPICVQSSFHPEDPHDWRHWQHQNRINGIVELKLV
jgi:hypothetical protein